MMDTGEGVPANLVETTRASLDAGGALTKRWHKASSGRIGYVYMPRFALSCTRELIEAGRAAKLSDRSCTTIERRWRAESRAMATGRTPISTCATRHRSSGRSRARVCTWKTTSSRSLNSEDIRRSLSLAELKRGSGIEQVARLRSPHPVGISTDGAACQQPLDGLRRSASLRSSRAWSAVWERSGYDAWTRGRAKAPKRSRSTPRSARSAGQARGPVRARLEQSMARRRSRRADPVRRRSRAVRQ